MTSSFFSEKEKKNLQITKKQLVLTCSPGVEKKLMREITPASNVQSLTVRIYFTLTFLLIKTNSPYKSYIENAIKIINSFQKLCTSLMYDTICQKTNNLFESNFY